MQELIQLYYCNEAGLAKMAILVVHLYHWIFNVAETEALKIRNNLQW